MGRTPQRGRCTLLSRCSVCDFYGFYLKPHLKWMYHLFNVYEKIKMLSFSHLVLIVGLLFWFQTQKRRWRRGGAASQQALPSTNRMVSYLDHCHAAFHCLTFQLYLIFNLFLSDFLKLLIRKKKNKLVQNCLELAAIWIIKKESANQFDACLCQ